MINRKNTTKMKDTHITKVRFLIHKKNHELIAYFPNEKYSREGDGDNRKTCYAHIGRHSACSPGYARECREATETEYQDLKNELQSLGYNLEVIENTFNKVVAPVNCKNGAPMGRIQNSENDKPTSLKIYDRKVNLNSGGYDKGGAYWGLPNNLRVEFTKTLKYVRFYRA